MVVSASINGSDVFCFCFFMLICFRIGWLVGFSGVSIISLFSWFFNVALRQKSCLRQRFLTVVNLLFVGMFIMVNQVQVNSLVIGYSFKYTDKIKCFSATSHRSHSIGSPRSFSVSAYMLRAS